MPLKRSRLVQYVINWQSVPVWIAFLTFLLSEFLSRNPDLTEKYYSRGLYPLIASVVSSISFHFPFSIDDIFYFFLLATLISTIFLVIIRKIPLKKALWFILAGISVCYTLFYWLWGFNYFREGLNVRLNIAEKQPEKQEFFRVLEELISETNSSYIDFGNFRKEEMDSKVEISWQKLAGFLNIKYPSGKRRAKNITLGKFFAKASISGYYGPFFNEVHVNRFVLPVEYPMVLAHEKAHQFGITGEGEASFYAWLVCSLNDSEQVKYSGNLMVLRNFLNQVNHLKEYPELIKLIDERVKDDFRAITKHWSALRNEKIDRAAGKVNDTYLKANKIKEGIRDYSGVVKYVMEFSLDSAARAAAQDLN